VAARARRVRQGEIVVEPATGAVETPVIGGLVHDWVGAAFIPGATLEKTLAAGQDYNRHKDIYRPEVMDSRTLAHTGDDFRGLPAGCRKRKWSPWCSIRSMKRITSGWTGRDGAAVPAATKIAEVKNAGQRNERTLPPERSRVPVELNSYWRFEERDGGTWVECGPSRSRAMCPRGWAG